MKRSFCLVLCIVMLALTLASCGEEPHVHAYNRDEWASDAANHWYAATCECEDAAKINSAAHVDSMNDGYCDVCNYLMCNNTAHKEEWSFDANAHWKAPVCGHKGHIFNKDHNPHVDADTDGVCDVCAH